MYIETSSPRSTGENAKLEKTGIKFTGKSCLHFSYHMYGASIGTLNVLVGGRNVFTKSGNQGNAWHNEIVKVSHSGVTSVSKLAFLRFDRFVRDCSQ